MSFQLKPPQTLESAYVAVVSYLETCNIHFGQGSEDSADEGYWIIQAVTKYPLNDIERHAEESLSTPQLEDVQRIVNERVDHQKPLAYVLGQAFFAGLSFIVNEHTIIPRSHLVEWLDDGFSPWVDINSVSKSLDLCCGSGCIGLALAHYFPHLSVDLADISANVLSITQQNIDALDMNERVVAIQSDLLSALPNRYDLILCNPPYVNEALMAAFPEEFKKEPVNAHWGGEDGLELVHRILREAPDQLSDNGTLIMELGSAAPTLDEAYPKSTFNWLMSESGESVVLIATRDELLAVN